LPSELNALKHLFALDELNGGGKTHSKLKIKWDYISEKKAKNSSAEVDDLIQRGEQILPIAVKGRHGNATA